MTRNLQSMTVSAETLAERIKTIECENWTLSKGYDRLIDRISIQEDTVHAMRIMSKEDMVGISNGQDPCLRIINEGDCVPGGNGVSDGQAPCLRIINEGFGA